MTGAVLDLQRSAGNQAVGAAIASRGNSAAKGSVARPATATVRDAAGSAAAPMPAMAAQLDAIWQALVVRSIARARERLDRTPKEPEAALQDLDTALAGIASVKGATPKGDDNHIRLEVLERRVRAFRDIVDTDRGKGKSDSAIENDMIAWRLEAVALGKEFDEPTGDYRSSEMPALWKQFVIDNLWQGQLAFSKGDLDSAYLAYLHAHLNVYRSVDRVAGYHRLQLTRLASGLSGTLALMKSRRNEGDGQAADAGIEAYETAAFLGRFLMGKPVEGDVVPTEAGGQGEPDFTWERPPEPVRDDTALERP